MTGYAYTRHLSAVSMQVASLQRFDEPVRRLLTEDTSILSRTLGYVVRNFETVAAMKSLGDPTRMHLLHSGTRCTQSERQI